MIVVVILILYTSSAGAQNYLIKTNALPLVFGGVNVYFEIKTSPVNSIQFSIGPIIEFDLMEAGFYSLDIGYRSYVFNYSPRGLYIMPFSGYQVSFERGKFHVGFNMGYQWVIGSRLVIDIGFGGIYNPSHSSRDDSSIDVIPNLYTAIGYVFTQKKKHVIPHNQ